MNPTENQARAKPRSFRSLWSSPNKASAASLFSDCIHAATSRTLQYLLFSDPKSQLQPSPATLCEVFLMTYIQRSNQINLTDTFNCTAMTQEQRVILGADWVWALVEPPGGNPRIQITVQVLHPPETTTLSERSLGNYKEISRMAGMEPGEKTRVERMVEFCSAVGSTCYALFLFFGRKDDPATICGLLSNNLHAAVGKCVRIDQAFIENFFRGARRLVKNCDSTEKHRGRVNSTKVILFQAVFNNINNNTSLPEIS
ncbi:hypothetical protein NFI96_002731 [Prochilodus magdalenae]|nr:hypothetical protein NFI96_002731 [Prochilodus magdalenae]